MVEAFFRDKCVFVTGSTGFKGSWLCLWLLELGARVVGYSTPPPTDPSNYQACGLGSEIREITGDVRDLDHLSKAVHEARPDLIFHLAAQPLVRASFRDPLLTYTTNVLGTVNVLEAARHAPGTLGGVVVVTSDKCYRPLRNRSCSEDDHLGGEDPYSASKACAELVAGSYAAAFPGQMPPVATARAGNVLGGGDWGEERLIPDCVRSLAGGRPVSIRNPGHVRPWQYVLDLLQGYLTLARRLYEEPEGFTGAWNFGPDEPGVTVQEVVEAFMAHWENGAIRPCSAAAGTLQENVYLAIDAAKANRGLPWRPRFPLKETLKLTAAWYRELYAGSPAQDLCRREISGYSKRVPTAL